MVRTADEPRPQFETEEDAVHRVFVEEVLQIKPSEEKTEEDNKVDLLAGNMELSRREIKQLLDLKGNNN